jgi:hypothetical protein
MQLPSGCVPPPAAFFLVEQLLRDMPSPTTMSLAIKLLRASVVVMTSAQQQQQHEGDGQHTGSAGSAELARLAYCSLAASVVQVANLKRALLEEASVEELLALAVELAQAAATQASNSSSGEESACGSSHIRVAVVGSATTTENNNSSSSSSDGGSGCVEWSLAASLAAAVAVAGYAVHWQQMEVVGAAGQAQQAHGRAPAGEEQGAGDSRAGEPQAGYSSSPSTSASTACIGEDRSIGLTPIQVGSNSSGSGAGSNEQVGAAACEAGCSACSCAIQVVTICCCLQHGGVTPRISQAALLPLRALLMQAAQQRGLTLQQDLRNSLFSLALGLPVRGVCSRVLCERLEGPSAMGLVRGRVGTLCGGCRAAWFCCEECQRLDWPVHEAVCRGRAAGHFA